MANQYPKSRFETETVDLLLSTLSHEFDRRTLNYVRESSETVVSLDELAENVAATLPGSDSGSSERVAVRLHHAGLPKLAAAGILDYDPRSRIVRCADHPALAVDGDG